MFISFIHTTRGVLITWQWYISSQFNGFFIPIIPRTNEAVDLVAKEGSAPKFFIFCYFYFIFDFDIVMWW